LQKEDCCVGQFILFSRISLAHASVEEIRQDVIRARRVWINTLSPVEQFSSNKNGRKYSN
jgi:hypothetical protein